MLPLNLFPPAFSDQYNIHKLQHNQKIYIKIKKVIYGLPQAGLLANQKLQKALHPYGYDPCSHTI